MKSTNLLRAILGTLVVAVCLVIQTEVNAQNSTADAPDSIVADPADVASIDAITSAAYASISGAKGVERNWNRFRSLFHPAARLIPVRSTPDGLRGVALTTEEFITNSNAYFVDNGFFEKELHRKTEQYGAIAHHFSTYASYDSATSTEPFARGINSFQLMHDGTRWWIVTIFWQAESEQNPIPDKYLDAMDR